MYISRFISLSPPMSKSKNIQMYIGISNQETKQQTKRERKSSAVAIKLHRFEKKKREGGNAAQRDNYTRRQTTHHETKKKREKVREEEKGRGTRSKSEIEVWKDTKTNEKKKLPRLNRRKRKSDD